MIDEDAVTREFLSTIPTIDAHHHLWNPNVALRYDWLNPTTNHPFVGLLAPIAKPYLLEDYQTDIKNQNIVKSVHLQAECSEIDHRETEWLEAQVGKSGFPNAIIGRGDPEVGPEQFDEVLRNHIAASPSGRFKGIRHPVTYHYRRPEVRMIEKDVLTNSDKWLSGLAPLASRGLSFDLQIFACQAQSALKAIRTYPSMPFILNHTLLPVDHNEEGFNEWKEAVDLLSREPNVSMKLSGIAMCYTKEIQAFYAKESDATKRNDYLRSTFEPYLVYAIQKFGPSRVMIASNFPVDKIPVSYDELFNATKDAIVHAINQDHSLNLTKSQLHDVFHNNAERFYRV
eukprot:TRINITY_DN10602_c0_g1_i1.p1 TRINITY_DN10602_c0_g1~~TRINITY_DN10602_c0_g1_i1.p1  ORF type:complete len:342 (-),score=46.91 TRINITY_DN10602_c0_g1_i1:60-1085(-)